jgi:hypothetical protein
MYRRRGIQGPALATQTRSPRRGAAESQQTQQKVKIISCIQCVDSPPCAARARSRSKAQRHRGHAQTIAALRLASLARSHLLTGEDTEACSQAGKANASRSAGETSEDLSRLWTSWRQSYVVATERAERGALCLKWVLTSRAPGIVAVTRKMGS